MSDTCLTPKGTPQGPTPKGPMGELTTRRPDEEPGRLKSLALARGGSVNKFVEELTTVALAQHDAWTWFRSEAAKGDPQRALELLDRLDRLEADESSAEEAR